EIEDFYVETMVFMPDECAANDRFGMIYRAPDNDRGYQYGLTCDGRYSLTLWDGDQTTVLVEPTANEAINVGLDAVNRLGVAAHGSNYLLYANGTFLAEVVDSTFTDTGMLGYFVRASSTNGFVVEYDNLAVWQLDDQFIPPTTSQPPTTGVIPTPDPGVPTVTTTTYVNVRGGPGTIYPVLFIAQPETAAEAVGISSDGAWYAIKVPTSVIESGIGWVSADFVVTSGTENLPVTPAPPPPPEIEPPPPEEGDAAVTTIDAVNIRSGPSNQCQSYGVPPIGTTAPAIGVSADGGWYTIRIPTDFSDDGIGWVNAVYVTANNTENLPVMESQVCP
ncbi:MAG: SH3 domain-containing protein, partial [Chloroflexota bacterium]